MTHTQIILLTCLGVVVGYLVGSIPFALLIGFSKGVDIRKQGSGNVGATNCGRVLGFKYFWYAFILDFFKGFAPVLACDLVVQHWWGPNWVPMTTAIAAIVGHVYPIYLRFKGGKGVATTFGALVGLWPVFTIAVFLAAVVFTIVFLAYRIISIASICAAVSLMVLVPVVGRSLPVIQGVAQPVPWNQLRTLTIAACIVGLLIVIKHRANIKRLLAGTEPRVGSRRTHAGEEAPARGATETADGLEQKD
ncbi:MAG: glycerol-3-phosphate 1-O-acyltransferase PlsY [Phycisphaerales bacterium]|nr:glycerol-3-phosphate 1-O-acyltransferase PlsY [Phycisphaerales bacterium]